MSRQWSPHTIFIDIEGYWIHLDTIKLQLDTSGFNPLQLDTSGYIWIAPKYPTRCFFYHSCREVTAMETSDPWHVRLGLMVADVEEMIQNKPNIWRMNWCDHLRSCTYGYKISGLLLQIFTGC
jgi:hypothetical protein